MTADDVRELLRRACEAAGSQAAWAEQHGITQAYVSDVLRGGREPGPAILEALNLDRSFTYRKRKA